MSSSVTSSWNGPEGFSDGADDEKSPKGLGADEEEVGGVFPVMGLVTAVCDGRIFPIFAATAERTGTMSCHIWLDLRLNSIWRLTKFSRIS